jgi:hypothetical protein
MYLVQLLLPAGDPQDDAASEAHVAETRAELVEAFGGLTAYERAPAHGVWRAPGGSVALDTVVMVEVVTRRFDRDWWRTYAERLRRRFRQEAIHVRAMPVELLDEDAI